tara:strand:- start:84209 stop:84691 length:483 start_codon:yes stop_codon:yes gene_type:complete
LGGTKEKAKYITEKLEDLMIKATIDNIKTDSFEFDAVSGLRVKPSSNNKMVKISVGLGEMTVNPLPTAVIEGVKFVFPKNAKWICVEPNGVVYWAEKQSRMSVDEYDGKPYGWGANKTPVLKVNEDGFLRAVIRKNLPPDFWKKSWERLATNELRYLVQD